MYNIRPANIKEVRPNREKKVVQKRVPRPANIHAVLHDVMKGRPRTDWDNADLVAGLLADRMSIDEDPNWQDDLLELSVLYEQKEFLENELATVIKEKPVDLGDRLRDIRKYLLWVEKQINEIPGAASLTNEEAEDELDTYLVEKEDARNANEEFEKEEALRKEIKALMGAKSVVEIGTMDDTTGKMDKKVSVVKPFEALFNAKNDFRQYEQEAAAYPKATDEEQAAAAARLPFVLEKKKTRQLESKMTPDSQRLALIREVDNLHPWHPTRRAIAKSTDVYDNKRLSNMINGLKGLTR